MTSRLAELQKMKDDYKARVKSEGEAIVKEAFAEFFKAHPEIEAIRWRQYTPYFNDGDACAFNVHDGYIRVQGVPEDAGDYEDGFFASYSVGRLAEAMGVAGQYGHDNPPPALAAFQEFWGSIADDDLFESVFGDHKMITATRDEFEVDDYSHD